MNYLNRLVLVVASAAFFIVPTQAQSPGTVTNHAFAVGKGPGVKGFSSVPCSSTQVPIGQSGDPSCKTLSGDVTNDASGVTAIGSGKVTSDKIAAGAVVNSKLSANAIPVFATRSAASALDLSGFSVIRTLGYSTGADGGGATFYKRSSAVIGYSITTAGSCGNGTWTGVKFTGGTGQGAAGTVVCSGGVATTVTLTGSGAQGNGYAAGDVLTASCNNIGSCVTAPQITVSSVGNGALTDAFTATFTTANVGAGCTNGTYYGVTATGGFGARLTGVAVIASNTLSSFTQSTPGGGYKVGDQLTLSGITGCGTAPVLAVATVTTPLASFTDSAGNVWQYASEANINVKQFGAVADFVAGQTDADATDNGPSFRAALQFASIGNGESDTAGGYHGHTVFVPQGSYKVCNGIVVYEYTTLRGAGWGASSIKQCNADSASTNFVTLGDKDSHVGNFENKIWDITLFGGFGSGTAYMIYSNNAQSGDAIARVAMYGVSRGCVKYDTGYGGQSMFGMRGWLCVINPTYFTSGDPAFDLSGNFGFVIDGQSHIAGAASSGAGVRFGDGGTAIVNGLHCEGGVTNCISVNGAGTSPPQVTVTAGLGPATNFIFIETGTPANYVTVTNTRLNGSTCLVYMQATATCAKNTSQLGTATY